MSKVRDYKATPGRNTLTHPSTSNVPRQSDLKSSKNADAAEREIKRRRRHAIGKGGAGVGCISLVDVEGEGEGTGRVSGSKNGEPVRVRMATLVSVHNNSPTLGVAKAIRDSLDPRLAPRPVQTLAQMSPEKRAEMERLYGRGPKK